MFFTTFVKFYQEIIFNSFNIQSLPQYTHEKTITTTTTKKKYKKPRWDFRGKVFAIENLSHNRMVYKILLNCL